MQQLPVTMNLSIIPVRKWKKSTELEKIQDSCICKKEIESW